MNLINANLLNQLCLNLIFMSDLYIKFFFIFRIDKNKIIK